MHRSATTAGRDLLTAAAVCSSSTDTLAVTTPPPSSAVAPADQEAVAAGLARPSRRSLVTFVMTIISLDRFLLAFFNIFFVFLQKSNDFVMADEGTDDVVLVVSVK